MTHPTDGPRLESHAARGELRGIALFCHGGTATSVAPPRERALSLVRMRAIEQFVRAAHGRPRDRHRTCSATGWPAGTAPPPTPTPTSAGRSSSSRAEHGADVPIVLVGHSMGGRAALRAGGDPQVAAVCALAPWTPPGEPVAHLRGRTVAILHGRGDRWVPAKLSADFAAAGPARPARRVARFTTPGGHSMLRGALRWHRFARDVVLGATGIEPMRADIANALRRPVPEGLAVRL